jgi:hypothetical protein
MNTSKLLAALLFAALPYVAQAQNQPTYDVCANPQAIRLIISKLNWVGLAGNPQTPPGVINNPDDTGVLVCKVYAGGLSDHGVVTLTWQRGQSPSTAVARFVSDEPPKCDWGGAKMHNATLAEFETVYHCQRKYYWK